MKSKKMNMKKGKALLIIATPKGKGMKNGVKKGMDIGEMGKSMKKGKKKRAAKSKTRSKKKEVMVPDMSIY